MTNFEKIKSMSIEEIEELMYDLEYNGVMEYVGRVLCEYCERKNDGKCPGLKMGHCPHDQNEIADWLMLEVVE